MAVRHTVGRVVIGSSDEFSASPVMNALMYLIGTIRGLQSVTKGIPEARATRTSASVTGGSMQPYHKAGATLLQRDFRFLVVFFYRVQGAQPDAEDAMLSAVDAFTVAFFRAEPGELFGTLRNMELDTSPADNPDYQIAAGQEVRVYPIVVTGTQQHALLQEQQ
jgi:hypothetical protein